ncbi:GTPase activating protein Gyp3 [Schizosaccharomyces cryophilus OY26]|uniref:GTPase activating protein Gyp3 n=1 Tax=Schizosaccharomyces cryophilus (strain OY26 / ATCC MYA-4695 / CBS 11777 / NBRC 106824 / NRRL Y48691) TaxID=653667 RepID=S9VUV4_SCHCR|nr:GTPase activating protein Gyp3 [Schizosaccharomyces cryophilus OY26]EPY49964.1 GTPase activating protein Gyp3 [Schizosaccharomyces cryophilus OY26]
MSDTAELAGISRIGNTEDQEAILSDESSAFQSYDSSKISSEYELDDVLDLYNDTTDDAEDTEDTGPYMLSPSSSISSGSSKDLNSFIYPIYRRQRTLVEGKEAESGGESDFDTIVPNNHKVYSTCAYIKDDASKPTLPKHNLQDNLTLSWELSENNDSLAKNEFAATNHENVSSKASTKTNFTIKYNDDKKDSSSKIYSDNLPFKINSINCDIKSDDGPLSQTFRSFNKFKQCHSEWDMYGFKKDSQFTSIDQYDTWFEGYSQYLDRREQKWKLLLSENGIDYSAGTPDIFPSRSAKVQRFIRKGIPYDLRGNAWFYYSGGYELCQRNPKLYETLWRCSCIRKPSDSDLIERDLYRTFPDNIYFRGKTNQPQRFTGVSEKDPDVAMIAKLRRVLMSFATYLPENGYCQSLNFLAGFFLLFMSEEKAFWMLVITCRKYLPRMHDANLEGANIDQSVLMASVRESLPAVWSRINLNFDGMPVNDIVAKLPPITLVTAAWFMSAFVGILPTETALRVWDCFFYEGSKVLFMTALCILRLGEDEIKSKNEQTDVFQVIQDLPKSLLDANAFVSLLFRRNFRRSPSQKDIDRRRQKIAKKRKKTVTKVEGQEAETSKPSLARSSSRFKGSHLISQLQNHLKKSS